MDRAPALVVEHLTRHFEERVAVDDLSFAVAPGEILGLVGPNGAGKTTTLRTVSGVLAVQEGRVRVAGHDLASEEAEAKRHLAWVPDDPEPFDTLTVREHLEFTARLYGVEDWEPRAADLLERFELQDRADALGGELSRGMRQKLAIAQAWLPSPALALLDEPLSGLDPRGIRSARESIRELAAGGAAVILSSHLLDLIEALAHRILILDRGRLLFLGTLAELRELRGEGSLEEVFLSVTGGEGARAAAAADALDPAGTPSPTRPTGPADPTPPGASR